MENNIINSLEKRYATKKFDVSKKLSSKQLNDLKKIISLTPTSYGIEPYRVLLVTEDKIRSELKKVSWNQNQVTDCSIFIVFAFKTTINESDIEEFIERMSNTRNISKDEFKVYKDMMIGDLVKGPRSKFIKEWAKNQAYIALGNTMTSLASMNIDSCPMEGFDPESYNKILNLEKEGLYPAVALAVGFRDETDTYATYKKVRLDENKMFKEI